jgi:uncharacterized protein YndB with AHSA1/START domain
MRTITCLHYIAATPDQVWQALTEPTFTRRYFFGLAVDSDWREDAPITYRAAGGPDWAVLTGHIVRLEPGRTLMYSLAETAWVTWTLDQVSPGLCRVTFVHDDLDPAGGEPLTETWHQVVGGLKTVLETGRALIG